MSRERDDHVICLAALKTVHYVNAHQFQMPEFHAAEPATQEFLLTGIERDDGYGLAHQRAIGI